MMSFLPHCKPNGEVFHGHPVFELDGVRAIILTPMELTEWMKTIPDDVLLQGLRIAVFDLSHISDKYFPCLDWSINSLSFRRYLDGVWIVMRPPRYRDEAGVWREKPPLDAPKVV